MENLQSINFLKNEYLEITFLREFLRPIAKELV